jgi:PhoH-like ATPase
VDDLAEHDVIIAITVLEELDNFKKGTQSVNFHARNFVRKIDQLSDNNIFNGGVSLGDGRGQLMIKLEKRAHPELMDKFPNIKKSDHQILNIAFWYQKENPNVKVVLISKDVNCRMKAKSIGLQAEDYTKDHVRHALSLGYVVKNDCSHSAIDRIHAGDDGVTLSVLDMDDSDVSANTYMILQSGQKSALGVYDSANDRVHRIIKESAYGITPRNAEQIFALHAMMDPGKQLVAVTGKAGTGKTLLALAASLEQRRYYRQILLARPILPLSNKDLGYLPGEISSKVKPYMQPLYDNLSVIKSQFDEKSENAQRLQKMLDEEKLAIEPLAYIRGRSLMKIYFIIDEAQNLTPHEIKTIVTRAAEGTKIVFTGDIEQIDHPYLDSRSNGLSHLIDRMTGQSVFAHVQLSKGERSYLSQLASDIL